MKRIAIVALAAGISSVLSAGLRADEIIFKNGDRLTGKIETYDGSKLTIDTPSVGKQSVDLKNVRTFSSTSAIEVVLPDGTVLHQRAEPGPDGQIGLAAEGTAPARTVPLSQIKQINPPPAKWTGSVTVGGLLARGNTDSDSFNALAHLTRRAESDRQIIDAGYIYGRERVPHAGKHETADDLFGQGEYDYFFTKKFFAYGNVRAEHDTIAGLALRLSPGVGIGYQWVESPTLSFSTEAGLGYLYRKYSHDGSTSSADARAAYHLTAKLNDKVNVFHNFEYLPGLDRINNYFFDTDAGVRATLTDKMFTEFKVEYRYDSKPSPGRGSSDLRYILGVGWNF